MKFKSILKILENISATIEIFAYLIFSFGPLVCGIYFLVKYLNGWYEKPHYEGMYLGMGIVSIIVGILVLFASYLRYRNIIINLKKNN